MIIPTVGQKILGNWGAMHPHSYGEIVKINDFKATIKWEDEIELDEMKLTEIKQPGETSSFVWASIGIFYTTD